MSRAFNAENEYTRYTCSPGDGCRLGSVQLGVLISGYFIPPPFPLRSPLTALPLSRFSSPKPASLPRPPRSPFLSFPSTSVSLSPVPALKCTTAPPAGQYEQEAYIANYTVLCHRARGWYRNTPRNLWRQREKRGREYAARGMEAPPLCAARRDRRFSYYPFYRFYPREYQSGSN